MFKFLESSPAEEANIAERLAFQAANYPNQLPYPVNRDSNRRPYPFHRKVIAFAMVGFLATGSGIASQETAAQSPETGRSTATCKTVGISVFNTLGLQHLIDENPAAVELLKQDLTGKGDFNRVGLIVHDAETAASSSRTLQTVGEAAMHDLGIDPSNDERLPDLMVSIDPTKVAPDELGIAAGNCHYDYKS